MQKTVDVSTTSVELSYAVEALKEAFEDDYGNGEFYIIPIRFESEINELCEMYPKLKTGRLSLSQ